jgi:hypothetical protein
MKKSDIYFDIQFDFKDLTNTKSIEIITAKINKELKNRKINKKLYAVLISYLGDKIKKGKIKRIFQIYCRKKNLIPKEYLNIIMGKEG